MPTAGPGNPVLETAVEGVELESFGRDIQDLIFKGTTAYSLFKSRAETVPVSNITAAGGITRPNWRVAFRPQGGAPIAVGTGNADSLGRGSGSQWNDFALTPVFLFAVTELSWLAQIATRGKNRALFSVKEEELKNSLQAALQGVEGLINGDGSGAIDQIPATAVITLSGGPSPAQVASIIGMNVAAAFTDQQVVSVFPSEGGVSRGQATISYPDAVTQTLFFSTVLPAGTTNGDYLMVTGASGAVNSSILGIRAWQVNSNVGTIGGISRALYPSRLSTPTINLNTGAITPGVAQRTLVLLGRALGPDAKSMKSGIWYGPPEQAYAISNLFYNVQISQNLQKGESVPDMAREGFIEEFGGRSYHTSWTAQPNRVDLLLMSTWKIGSLLEMELYDFGGGNVVAPVPDVGTTNGTYLTSHMYAYNVAFQLCNASPRSGLYIQNAAVPVV
jgi:hypothetical protein